MCPPREVLEGKTLSQMSHLKISLPRLEVTEEGLPSSSDEEDGESEEIGAWGKREV